jgi:hypothetical protein
LYQIGDVSVSIWETEKVWSQVWGIRRVIDHCSPFILARNVPMLIAVQAGAMLDS